MVSSGALRVMPGQGAGGARRIEHCLDGGPRLSQRRWGQEDRVCNQGREERALPAEDAV